MTFFDIDTEGEQLDKVAGIVLDIDAQWDLYLANSYSIYTFSPELT